MAHVQMEFQWRHLPSHKMILDNMKQESICDATRNHTQNWIDSIYRCMLCTYLIQNEKLPRTEKMLLMSLIIKFRLRIDRPYPMIFHPHIGSLSDDSSSYPPHPSAPVLQGVDWA